VVDGSCRFIEARIMPSEIQCPAPQCGKLMTVADELLGKEVQCPNQSNLCLAAPSATGTSGLRAGPTRGVYDTAIKASI
jgi:hypothetical protein